MILLPILAPYVRSVWSQIEPWIAAATADTGDWWQPADVLAAVECGGLTLWVISGDDGLYGTVVTDIETAPSRKIAVIALCGGIEQHRWLHLLNELEDWARGMGCTEVQVRGRPGWVRRLRTNGYKQRYITVGKDLS